MGTLIPLRPCRTESIDDVEGVSDAQLVTRARTGSQAATETLYRRHARMIFGMVHRLIAGDPSEVDDLVQDTFLSAFSRLDQLDDGQAFAAWTGTIAIRRVREHLRRKRLRRLMGLEAASSPAPEEHLVSPTAPADVIVELRALYALLANLPADTRIALVLRRVEGLTVPEIAAQMGTSIATVKRRVAAGERALMKGKTRTSAAGGAS